MITPTVGRKVWYIPSDADLAGNFGMMRVGHQPLDATVLAVWGSALVNLLVVDHYGKTFPVTSVKLVESQDAPGLTGKPGEKGYATWMPYQVGQAAKAATPAATPATPHIVREEIEELTNRVVEHMSDGTIAYRSATGVKQSDLIGN